MIRNRYAMVVLCFAATSTMGQEFDLAWHSIDGGGVMRSTGGGFELSGTIGQPDAGILNGGEFSLSGGFWFELSPTDCNDDGTVDLLDHELFTGCLAGPDGGVPGGCECLDVDRSGAIDLRDFAVAQAAHSGL